MTAGSGDPSQHGDWTILVPLKSLTTAKSRFAGLGDSERRSLVVAMAADVLESSLRCEQVARVLVVAPDVEVMSRLPRNPRVEWVCDTTGDLNAALVSAVVTRTSSGDGPFAVVMADLPALTSAELSAVLIHARPHPCAFVADADGAGTTIYCAGSAGRFSPEFGRGSRAAHRRSRVHEVTASPMSGIRLDVDDATGLARARAAGVGEHTSGVSRAIDRRARGPIGPRPVPHLTGSRR